MTGKRILLISVGIILLFIAAYFLFIENKKKNLDLIEEEIKIVDKDTSSIDITREIGDSTNLEVHFSAPYFSNNNYFDLFEGFEHFNIYLQDLINNIEKVGNVGFFVRPNKLPVQLKQNNILTITSFDQNWFGCDTITIGLINENREYYFHKLFINVKSVNDPPVFFNLPALLEFDEDDVLEDFRLIDYTVDIDNDISDLKFDFVESKNISVTESGNGVFQISSKNKNWFGIDSITFSVTDDGKNFIKESILIKVNPVNDPPVVFPVPSQTIFANQSFNPVHLDDYVEDPDDDKIGWEIVGNKNISVNINNGNIASFNYPEGWIGSDTLIFIAEDEGGLKSTTSTIFTVKEIEFWDKQPQKDIKTLASLAVEDAVSLAITPFRWDMEDWLLFGGVLGGTAALFTLDKEIKEIGIRNSHLKDTPLIEAGEFYGRGSTAYLLSGAVAGFGLVTQNKKILLIGLELFESYWVANTITSNLKGLFGRSRPYASEDNFDFHWTDYEGSWQKALPSGHATVAFSMSSVLAAHVDEWYWKAAFYAPAVLTVTQRIVSNSHWISDTFFGAAIGYFVGNYLVNRHKGVLDDSWVIGIDPMGRLNIVYNLN